MNKPHKHAELIKAWADGAIIQYKLGESSDDFINEWQDVENPDWNESWCMFRIKPEPKPDVVGNVYANSLGTLEWIMGQMKPNLKLTFDGETGELKSAEVLK